jgi:hypothetical protein
MDRKQFQINGYVSLFGNSREALFIYSKFGDIRGHDAGSSKLSSLNTKLVNKIVSGNQLLSGSNYVLRRHGNSPLTNSDSGLAEAFINQREFTFWLDKHNFGDMFRLQNFIVSGLILDSFIFNELSKPVYSYIKSNASLLVSDGYANFSNNLKMYLTFPAASFTFLSFLKLLMTPMKITFGFMGFVKNNKE